MEIIRELNHIKKAIEGLRTSIYGRSIYEPNGYVLTLDKAAYASEDVLSDEVEIGPIQVETKRNIIAILGSVVVIDKDDQGGAFDIIFTNEQITINTKNSAWNSSDADMAKVQAIVNITSDDYADFVSSQVAIVKGLWIPIKPDVDNKIYMYTISRDTKTYTEDGLIVKLGFVIDQG